MFIILLLCILFSHKIARLKRRSKESNSVLYSFEEPLSPMEFRNNFALYTKTKEHLLQRLRNSLLYFKIWQLRKVM